MIKDVGGIPEVYSFGLLRQDNPNVSFPMDPAAEVIAPYDAYYVTTLDEPLYDVTTEYLVKDDITEISPGEWVQGWIVTSLSPETLQFNLDNQIRGDIYDVVRPHRVISALIHSANGDQVPLQTVELGLQPIMTTYSISMDRVIELMFG